MGDLMGDLRNNPRPPFPPGQNGGPIPPKDPIRQPLPPQMAPPDNSTGQGLDPIRQPLPPVGDTTGQGLPVGFQQDPLPPAFPPRAGNGSPGPLPPQMAPPMVMSAPASIGAGMTPPLQQDPIRRPLPPQMPPRGREFYGPPTSSPGAPKMTDQTNNARKISAPRIPPMSGGAPGWYGKNAPQGGSFTPPPSAGLMAGQDPMNRKRKVTPVA